MLINRNTVVLYIHPGLWELTKFHLLVLVGFWTFRIFYIDNQVTCKSRKRKRSFNGGISGINLTSELAGKKQKKNFTELLKPNVEVEVYNNNKKCD